MPDSLSNLADNTSVNYDSIECKYVKNVKTNGKDH